MDEASERKYRKVLDILPDLAINTYGKFILVGGTALTIFYLKHRISVDLDFVPVTPEEDCAKAKEELKGAMSRGGYQTHRAAHLNQFVIQFPNTTIKVEIFNSEHTIENIEEQIVSGRKISVASLKDLMEMKIIAYKDRKASRDLFDLVEILKKEKKGFALIRELIEKYGKPENIDDISGMVFEEKNYLEFVKVVEDAKQANSHL